MEQTPDTPVLAHTSGCTPFSHPSSSFPVFSSFLYPLNLPITSTGKCRQSIFSWGFHVNKEKPLQDTELITKPMSPAGLGGASFFGREARAGSVARPGEAAQKGTASPRLPRALPKWSTSRFFSVRGNYEKGKDVSAVAFGSALWHLQGGMECVMLVTVWHREGPVGSTPSK